MKTVKTVALGLLLTALVATSAILVVLMSQNMQEAEELRHEVAQIQNLVSVQSAESPSAEASGDKEEPKTAERKLERCEGGELRYHSIYTPLTFCYPTKLGAVEEEETGVSPEAREGTMYTFKFNRDDDIRINLRTANFRLTGDRDVPNEVSFSCIDFNKSNDDLIECFFDEVISLERLIINDTKALLVTLDIKSLEDPRTSIQATRLIIPDILEQPRMDAVVLLEPEQTEEVRKILESIQ